MSIRFSRWHSSALGETVLKEWSKRALLVAAAIFVFADGAEARITRIEIVKSEPAFRGASFGEPGAYVRLVRRVSGKFDPADPANAVIQDISSRLRNAHACFMA